MRMRGYSLALSLAIGISATAARAEEPGPNALPVIVVALQTSDADDQAAALTRALKNAVRTTAGWSLGEGDYSLEVLTLTLKCSEPPDASCESQIAEQIKADRYIWGIVDRKGPDLVGELHFWVRGKDGVKIGVRHSANLTEPNDDALKKVANELLTQLTGGPPKGSLHVKAGSLSGQVFINGQPAGALVGGNGTFPLPSGAHQIIVKAPGYSDVEGSVVVKPNATAELLLAPLPFLKETPSTVDGRQVGGFIGLGAGVAFGVVGLVSALQVNAVQQDPQFAAYQEQFPGADDVCEKANENATPLTAVSGAGDAGYIADGCKKAQTFEIMQVIFFPLAAIAGGAGLYLLTTNASPPAATTGLTFRPQLGASHGKLDVTFRW